MDYAAVMLSLIIPVFNEEGAVLQTVLDAHATLLACKQSFEVIVVNDGSTDVTSDILAKISLPHFSVITHLHNKGNGAAIMTGAEHARGSLIATIDADGTYPIHTFPHLLVFMEKTNAAMIVGKRSTRYVPFYQRIAKTFLTKYGEWLISRSIPDINSGMRIVRRDLFDKWLHLYPKRFSLHITLTLCSLLAEENVRYVPIEYYRRIGQSSMTGGLLGIKHFFQFFLLMKRVTEACKQELTCGRSDNRRMLVPEDAQITVLRHE